MWLLPSLVPNTNNIRIQMLNAINIFSYSINPFGHKERSLKWIINTILGSQLIKLHYIAIWEQLIIRLNYTKHLIFSRYNYALDFEKLIIIFKFWICSKSILIVFFFLFLFYIIVKWKLMYAVIKKLKDTQDRDAGKLTM